MADQTLDSRAEPTSAELDDNFNIAAQTGSGADADWRKLPANLLADLLETLTDGDRLDSSAIKNLSVADAVNVLLAIKDFDEDQVSAAQLALSLVGGVSSFDSEGTYTANSLNTSHDGGAYIPTIDEVWIVDDADNRIYRYETDGTSLGVFNTDSSNSSPDGIAYIDSIDEVWVIDGSNIHRYETDRSYIGTHASGFTGNNLTGIAYDTARDVVIILNDTSDIIYFYNTDGTWTNEQMSLDSNNGNPSGVTYYTPLDEIWVVDNTDNQIYRYSGESRTLTDTENLNSNNDDSRFIAYISAVEEVWVGQNPSVNIYRYTMEVSIDRDKLIEAFENFSTSQLSDTQDALGISNVRVVENDEVTYASGNPQTISITGPDAEIGDVVIFQYRSSFTPGAANVTLQVGNDDRDQIRILSLDGSLRWLTLNDLTRYAIYVMFRADGVWQYIGGTRDTPFRIGSLSTELSSPATGDRIAAADVSTTNDDDKYLTLSDLSSFILDIHERVSTEMTAPHADDRMLISDESDSGDPTEYVDMGTLSTYFLDLHERITTELTELEDDDRIAVSDESESGEPTKYVKMENVADFVGGGSNPEVSAPDTSGWLTSDGTAISTGTDATAQLNNVRHYTWSLGDTAKRHLIIGELEFLAPDSVTLSNEYKIEVNPGISDADWISFQSDLVYHPASNIGATSIDVSIDIDADTGDAQSWDYPSARIDANGGPQSNGDLDMSDMGHTHTIDIDESQTVDMPDAITGAIDYATLRRRLENNTDGRNFPVKLWRVDYTSDKRALFNITIEAIEF